MARGDYAAAKLIKGGGQSLRDIFCSAAFNLAAGNEVDKLAIAEQGQAGRRRRKIAEVLAGALRGLRVLAGKYAIDTIGPNSILQGPAHTRPHFPCRTAANGIYDHERGAGAIGKCRIDFCCSAKLLRSRSSQLFPHGDN